MPYNIEYQQDADYIEAVFTDCITMGVIQTYLPKLLPVLEQTGCKRVLTDAREAKFPSTVRDILQLPKMLAASPLTRGLKRAILYKEWANGFDLYEIISNMQGQNVQIFTDREAALEWLLSDAN